MDVRDRRASCRRARSRRATVVAVVAAVVGLGLMASAAAAAPAWQVESQANTTVAPGGTLHYLVQITNVGDANADLVSNPLTFTAHMPSGLQVTSLDPLGLSNTNWDCSGTSFPATDVTCTNGADLFSAPDLCCSNFVPLHLTASVDPGASGELKASFAVVGGDPSNPTGQTIDATTVTPAPPTFGVDAFDGQVSADPAGDPFTQAAGHPFDASTTVSFNTTENPRIATPMDDLWPVEPVRDIHVDLPPGFVGNPTGATQCTAADLAFVQGGFDARPLCAPSSQVGTSLIRLNGLRFSSSLIGPVPVFNMVPPANAPARFGFNVSGTVVVLDARLRSDGDYGLSIDAKNVPETLGITGTTVKFWGVPAAASHDSERACAGEEAPWLGGPHCTSGQPLSAFLRNPTSCTPPGVGLPTTVSIDSWDNPGVYRSSTFFSHLPPAYPEPPSDQGPQQGTTDCDKVAFDPALTGAPTSPAVAGAPTGFTFDVTLPQTDDPSSIGEADLRRAVVTLPAGVSVSPSSADGLAACSSAQIGLLGTNFAEPNRIRFDQNDPACPESSKLGTVTIETPLLDKPVTGSIYLAAPHDNPFDTLVSIYLVAKGPGIIIKLPGKIEMDQTTGQVTATFDDNPQLPFSNLHLEFKSGARAPLVTPTCGTYKTHAVLTSWSDKVATSDSDFTISADGHGAPCPAPRFAPRLTAGTQDPVAGADSSFQLGLSRTDQDQELQNLTVDMPTGVTGRIVNASQCSDSAANAGTCTDASKLGSVAVAAGAGTNPFWITNGRAYLTGPYKGGPFGLSIVVPAVAGPFDLGDVVVRAKVEVDRVTAQLHVVSDPFPTILQGIPLDVREVRVAIDRPHFIVNPTSCAEKEVAGTVGSTSGATAHVSSRFQVGECAALDLKPKLAIALTGKGQTTDDKHPAVVANLTQPLGQANLKKVTVSLPLSLALDPENANGLCEFADGSKDDPTCPKASIVGTATARTPILNQPLTGPVYFVKNIRKDPKSGREIRTLPKLVIPLTGENGVRLNVTGTSSVVGGRLVTTFDNLPDAPVSSFRLNIAGGKHGILVVSGTDICKATQVADQQINGQNGKTADTTVTLATPACGLKVLSKKVGKRSVTLKVSGLGVGKLTITGKGIRKTSRTIKAATVATVTAKRTGHGRPSRVRVTFTPQGSHKTIATTVSLRSAHAAQFPQDKFPSEGVRVFTQSRLATPSPPNAGAVA